MTNQLTPEAIYLRLGSLIAEAPDAKAGATPDTYRWIARVLAVIEAGKLADDITVIKYRVASQNLVGVLQESNMGMILAIAHQALAKAELDAPVELQGAFIAAGNTFDAFAAVGKVLSMATADVLFVDPFANATLLTEYAVLAPDTVTVRILSGPEHKSSLRPAVERWAQQMKQPIDVRLGARSTLHDRLISIDGKTVFSVGQSFKDLATRAHTSFARMPADAGRLKIEAHELMWSSATPL